MWTQNTNCLENASFPVGQAQNYTDSDSTVHLEDRQDGDKQEETRRSESVIHLDLIQDTIGESLKPKPNEQEDGNPLLHEEGNSHWESSLSEGYYDKSGTSVFCSLFPLIFIFCQLPVAPT